MSQEINAPWRTEPSWRELLDKTWAPTENAALLDSTGKILATVWTGTRLPTSAGTLAVMRAAPELLAEVYRLLDALRAIQEESRLLARVESREDYPPRASDVSEAVCALAARAIGYATETLDRHGLQRRTIDAPEM
jgi:hypothetical protein